MIIIAEETLFFRREGLSPSLRLLVPTFLLHNTSWWVTPYTSAQLWTLSYRLQSSIKFSIKLNLWTLRSQVCIRWRQLAHTWVVHLLLRRCTPQNSQTQLKNLIEDCNPVSSVIYLNPDYLWRRNPRWVSCYAFFQWWLLLSQHPHCLWIPTSSLVLSIYLGTLNYDLGCFPFDQWNFAPTVLLPDLTFCIRSLIGFSALRQVKTFQCSTPKRNIRR